MAAFRALGTSIENSGILMMRDLRLVHVVYNHEEADTLMICLVAAASQRCPGARMVFFSPDTDVLVLAIVHYDKLCKNTAISMVSGVVEIAPIWGALGEEKAAMYSMHSLVQTLLEDSPDLAK